LRLRYLGIKAHTSIGFVQAKLGNRGAALSECQQALSLMGKIHEDPTNTGLRTLRAESFTDLAAVYAVLATAGRATTDDRQNDWRSTRDMYQRSLDIWLDLRRRGIITGVDAAKPEAVERELAKCDAALGK
jgi:hypothetical protein